MMLMSTYGTTKRTDHETRREWINSLKIPETMHFKYPEIVRNHYKYRHAVDDHNAKRHAPISLEVTWGTKSWPHRCFAFFLALSEVNCYLASMYFHNKEAIGMLAYRKQLAKELIFNDYLQEQDDGTPSSSRKSPRTAHALQKIPAFKKFSGTRLVKAASKYPQCSCFMCKKKVRTYCQCTPGQIICGECHLQHVLEADKKLKRTD